MLKSILSKRVTALMGLYFSFVFLNPGLPTWALHLIGLVEASGY
jgi:hypothetical protein